MAFINKLVVSAITFSTGLPYKTEDLVFYVAGPGALNNARDIVARSLCRHVGTAINALQVNLWKKENQDLPAALALHLHVVVDFVKNLVSVIPESSSVVQLDEHVETDIKVSALRQQAFVTDVIRWNYRMLESMSEAAQEKNPGFNR